MLEKLLDKNSCKCKGLQNFIALLNNITISFVINRSQLSRFKIQLILSFIDNTVSLILTQLIYNK